MSTATRRQCARGAPGSKVLQLTLKDHRIVIGQCFSIYRIIVVLLDSMMGGTHDSHRAQTRAPRSEGRGPQHVAASFSELEQSSYTQHRAGFGGSLIWHTMLSSIIWYSIV